MKKKTESISRRFASTAASERSDGSTITVLRITESKVTESFTFCNAIIAARISSITVRRRKRMEVPKIKRCPFCGEKADLRTDNEEVWVECEECYARGPEFGLANNGGNSNIEAVVACVNGWNERAVVEEEEED